MRHPLALLLIFTAAVFVPVVLFGQFIWDDELLVVGNQLVGQPGRLGELFTADLWSTAQSDDTASNYYRPLFLLSLAMDRALFGLSPVGHHLTSLAWHLACVALLWRLLGRLAIDRTPRILAASLFALHPLQLEAVAFVSARNDSMAAAFTLAAMLLCLKRGRTILHLFPAAGLAAMAVLTKESALVIPGLYLAIHLAAPGDGRPGVLRGFLAMAAGVTAALFLRFDLGHPLTGEDTYLGLTDTIEGSTAVALHYLGLLLWPAGGAPTATIQNSPSLLHFALFGGLLIAGALIVGRRKALGGLVFAAIALAPSAWAIQHFGGLGFRYAYLPLAGISIAFAAGLEQLLSEKPLPVSATIALPALLAASTLSMMPAWSSTEALWRDSHEVAPSAESACGLFKALEGSLRENPDEIRSMEARAMLRESTTRPVSPYCCLSATRWHWESTVNGGHLLEGFREVVEAGHWALDQGCPATGELLAPLAMSHAVLGEWEEAESYANMVNRDPFGFTPVVLSAAAVMRGDSSVLEAFIESGAGDPMEIANQVNLLTGNTNTLQEVTPDTPPEPQTSPEGEPQTSSDGEPQ